MTCGRVILAAAAPMLLALLIPPGQGELQRLGWMAGCWEFRAGELTVEEQWMAPRGGSMVGMSRTVRGERMVAHEAIMIREDSAGLAYHASPSGQPSAVFPALEVSDSHAVFADPGHDFPQRIIYRRRPDSLLARVEGVRDGQTRGLDFPYGRVECPGESIKLAD